MHFFQIDMLVDESHINSLHPFLIRNSLGFWVIITIKSVSWISVYHYKLLLRDKWKQGGIFLSFSLFTLKVVLENLKLWVIFLFSNSSQCSSNEKLSEMWSPKYQNQNFNPAMAHDV